MPFIRKHSNYIFWPDFASSHYANSVLNYLREQKIKFVEKTENPANVPEARPIEDFWADLKREVYKKNWSAKNVTKLKSRIRYCLKKNGPEKNTRESVGSPQEIGFYCQIWFK